jgi:hypothetical protein
MGGGTRSRLLPLPRPLHCIERSDRCQRKASKYRGTRPADDGVIAARNAEIVRGFLDRATLVVSARRAKHMVFDPKSHLSADLGTLRNIDAYATEYPLNPAEVSPLRGVSALESEIGGGDYGGPLVEPADGSEVGRRTGQRANIRVCPGR